jgi:hypothetical protein
MSPSRGGAYLALAAILVHQFVAIKGIRAVVLLIEIVVEAEQLLPLDDR